MFRIEYLMRINRSIFNYLSRKSQSSGKRVHCSNCQIRVLKYFWFKVFQLIQNHIRLNFYYVMNIVVIQLNLNKYINLGHYNKVIVIVLSYCIHISQGLYGTSETLWICFFLIHDITYFKIFELIVIEKLIIIKKDSYVCILIKSFIFNTIKT